VLPAVIDLLGERADLVALIKPQFEVGRGQVGRGGLVKDPELHADVLSAVARSAAEELAYAIVGACPSPITGAEGNREFFVHLRPSGEGLRADEREAAMRNVALS
jgi:23S rRNA (cytidine1920-2'-O)/16S rRNA (cytidine1409-2'-O)-methyltransferase